MSRMVLLILALFTCSVWASEDADDPFRDDERSPIIPLKADFLMGSDDSESNVELMVKSLPVLPAELQKLPLVTRDLPDLPHMEDDDKLYDISDWFPNCDEGREDLWVVYNARSGYLIASADPLLRASVNEYVDGVVMNQLPRMRLSVSYLIVDRDTPLNVGAIKKGKHRKVMSFSGEFRSGERVMLGHKSQSISGEVTLSEGALCAYVTFKLHDKNEFDVEVSSHLQVGVEEVVHVGITEGGEKGVMVLSLDCLDLNGSVRRKKQVASNYEIPKYSLRRSFIEGREHLFWRVPDLVQLLGEGEERLIAHPGFGFFGEDAILYDFSDVLEFQGGRVYEDEWAIYDRFSGVLVVSGRRLLLDLVEELSNELFVSYGANISVSTHFYEIDTIRGVGSEEEWDLLRVLSSNPKLLGSVGYFLGSGEEVRHGSKQGGVALEVIMDETGYLTEQTYRLDFNLLGNKIKFDLKVDVPYDKPIFIELQDDPASDKSLIMMILTKKKRIFHS